MTDNAHPIFRQWQIGADALLLVGLVKAQGHVSGRSARAASFLDTLGYILTSSSPHQPWTPNLGTLTPTRITSFMLLLFWVFRYMEPELI